jgi:tetratricopeptide (TPR) repeat protein
MASVYQAASAALAKLGDAEAAWIAADRAIAAAGRTGRPELVAAGAYRQVFVFLAARSLDQAEETARTAADAIALLAVRGEAAAVSLLGGLTLQRAVIAARRGDADAAYRHLDEARVLAGRLGAGRGDHHTEFGPVNVVLHEVAIAVELGDAGRALRTAAGLDTSGLSPERRARLLLDVARAHAQLRQPAEATAALLEADGLTPEQVRSHGLARQLATDLLGWLQPPPAELRELAASFRLQNQDLPALAPRGPDHPEPGPSRPGRPGPGHPEPGPPDPGQPVPGPPGPGKPAPGGPGPCPPGPRPGPGENPPP